MILFHPLFNKQWQELLDLVKSLRSRLSQEYFVQHPQVKLFKALTVGIEEKILTAPLASYFALRKPLDKYSRLKKMGLPSRYRLFFKVFLQQKVIIILWLVFPRRETRKMVIAYLPKWLNAGGNVIYFYQLARHLGKD